LTPARVVLVHGAANSAGVWRYWRRALGALGANAIALDLRGHGNGPPADLATASMADYAEDVRRVVRAEPEPPILIGWSMGGLVAMMVAADGGIVACVGLAPSTPARVRRVDVQLRSGVFGPDAYGIVDRDPERQPTMPDLDEEERRLALGALGQESLLARDERQAGVVIERMPCPLLIVTGTWDTQWPRGRYTDLPFPADFVEIEASHWGLVLRRECVERLAPLVLDWAVRPRV
jgi:pimeloyl-ACP methyl ester carboxylesterase